MNIRAQEIIMQRIPGSLATEPAYYTRPAYRITMEPAKRPGVIGYLPFEKIKEQAGRFCAV